MLIQRHDFVQGENDAFCIIAVWVIVLADLSRKVENKDAEIVLHVDEKIARRNVLVHNAIAIIQIVYNRQNHTKRNGRTVALLS